MKLKLFSIMDLKAGVFMAPFPARHEVDATRQIAASMSDQRMQETPVAKHPEDFALYALADFDDETGELVARVPSMVARVRDLLPQAESGTVRS